MLTKDNARQLDAAIEILARFREVDQEMSISAALTFLYVANKQIKSGEGSSNSNVSEDLGMTPSSASRNLLLLGEWKSKLRPDQPKTRGYDLISVDRDPAVDARKTVATLRPRGKLLVQKIVSALEGLSS